MRKSPKDVGRSQSASPDQGTAPSFEYLAAGIRAKLTAGDFQGALTDLNGAEAAIGPYIDIFACKGEAYEGLNQLNNALNEYKKILRKQTKDGGLNEEIAYHALALGESISSPLLDEIAVYVLEELPAKSMVSEEFDIPQNASSQPNKLAYAFSAASRSSYSNTDRIVFARKALAHDPSNPRLKILLATSLAGGRCQPSERHEIPELFQAAYAQSMANPALKLAIEEEAQTRGIKLTPP
ncbi:MAG: hypothetical protein ABL949_07650 [Fimbriimonadaceae bacterium]